MANENATINNAAPDTGFIFLPKGRVISRKSLFAIGWLITR